MKYICKKCLLFRYRHAVVIMQILHLANQLATHTGTVNHGHAPTITDELRYYTRNGAARSLAWGLNDYLRINAKQVGK
jgi:hypothetical protein